MTNSTHTVEKTVAPCPFCGGEGRPATVQAGGIEWAQIECHNPKCGAIGPSSTATVAKAIPLWNARASHSTPAVEALRIIAAGHGCPAAVAEDALTKMGEKL